MHGRYIQGPAISRGAGVIWPGKMVTKKNLGKIGNGKERLRVATEVWGSDGRGCGCICPDSLRKQFNAFWQYQGTCMVKICTRTTLPAESEFTTNASGRTEITRHGTTRHVPKPGMQTS